MEIHDPETSPASDKFTDGRGSTDPYSNGTAETTTGGIVERRIMDAAGVQAQQYDSEVNDRGQVFVDCIDTHANTEQRHDRPSESDETDPQRSASHRMCLSAAVRPHYCTDPVVHYWADLQSGHGLRCYGNITRTLGISLRPSREGRDMTT